MKINNLVYVTCIMLIMLVGTISSFEIDNYKDYDEEIKIMTIRNGFTFGTAIAEIELKTPLNYKVPRGYQKVAELEVRSFEDYNNAFKELELFDKTKSMNKFVRDYDFKSLSYETIIINDYTSVCSDVLNANGTYSKECNKVLSGTHEEQKEKWTKLNITDFKKDDVLTIGIFTDVKKGDIVEWIPNFFGVRIDEWAVWVEDLNVGLFAYYKFDETSGVVVDSVEGLFNGTNNGAIRGEEGIINNSFNFSSDSVSLSGSPVMTNFTAVIWINPETWAGATDATVFDFYTPGTDGVIMKEISNTMHWAGANSGHTLNEVTFAVPPTNTWTMLTGVYDTSGGGNLTMYYNDTLVVSSGGGLGNLANLNMNFFARQISTTRYFDGRLDEAGLWNRSLSKSEITTLYNNGAGLRFPWGFITLNSPEDNSFFPTNEVEFNCSAEVGVGATLVNISLYHNGTGSFELNQTETVSGLSNTSVFNSTFSDGSFIWNCEACDTDGDCGFASANRTFETDFSSPLINVTSPRGLIDFHIFGDNLTLNWSATDNNLNSCWFEYNSTNTTVTCGDNNFSFITITQQNLTFYANDSAGNLGSNFTEWDYKILQTNQSFNTNTFETQQETFNVNTLANSSLTSISLFYKDTIHIATQSGSNGTVTIDIPTGAGNNSFNWIFDYSGEEINSSSNNQIVEQLFFVLCNSTINVTFINFTFKNETVDQEDVTSTISSTFNFWLGSGSVNKTLVFSNSTENAEYSFCSSASAETIKIDYSLVYNNAVSQQRSFAATSLLTNISFNQILYLLPTSLGLFSQFRVEDTVGNVLSLVKGVVTRTLEGSTITVAVDFTDSSGFSTYFLNPDQTYTGTFSKSGFIDNIFTFVPTSDIRTVVMGTTGITNITGSNISEGMNYLINPTNTSLSNDTIVEFSFNVTGNADVTLISMNITNSSGEQFLFVSNAGQGIISGSLNTSKNKTFLGEFIIQTTNETITINKRWIIGNDFIGDYSLFNQMSFFIDYGFGDFIKMLIVLIVLIGTLIFITATEITDTSEDKIIVSILIIWTFSIVGWLDTGLSTGSVLSEFSNQYGIAILSTASGIFFIFRRIFIRRI